MLLTVQLAIAGSVELATEGPLHEWAGVGTYVLGCLCLLAVGEALRRKIRADRFQTVVLVVFLLMGLNVIRKALQ